MSGLNMFNRVSGSNKRDNLEQDLAEKLTRENPRTSSDGKCIHRAMKSGMYYIIHVNLLR